MAFGFPKPVKGTALLAARKRRSDRVSAEQAVMKQARKRDENKCRVPRCEFAPKKLPIDVCHVTHRGAGGNPDLSRTALPFLFCACRAHHGQYDASLIDVRPLTADGMNGACDWHRKHPVTGEWEQFASEQRIGVSVSVGA